MSLFVEIRKRLGKYTLETAFETDGGITGLLGASGSGKSMTLRCIAGIMKPDSGRIVLDGVTLFDSERNINIPPQSRRIGYLFQNYALFPNMTARQNIYCGLHREKDKSVRKKAFDEVIELLHLGGLEHRRPAQLSGGEQQRVALARILVGQPELLMLDEPFAALDTHLRSHMQIQMQGIMNSFGKDVIMVTHSRTEAYRLCGKIALLDAGKIIAHKETKALFADPESRQAARLTGCKNIADAVKIGEFELEVPEWGVRFETALPVRDDLCAVAVRAHYFSTKTEKNRQTVKFTGEIQEPFECILQFRFAGQLPDSPDIWWRLSKDIRGGSLPDGLGVDPVNVLPLYS